MSQLVLALLLGQSAAPPPGVIVTVRHAAGQPLGGGWQPYVVDAQNRSPTDQEIRVELIEEHSESRASRTEHLGPHARKRFHVYLPLPPMAWVSSVKHRVSVNGRAPGDWSDAVRDNWQGNARRIALLSLDPAAPEVFGLPVSGGRNTTDVSVARFSPESLPDRCLGFDDFRALVLHDPPWDQFSFDQGRALADYVRDGGLLVVCPGPRPGALAHPILQNIASVASTGLDEVAGGQGLGAYPPLRSKDPYALHRLSNGTPFRKTPVRRYPVGIGELRIVPFDVRRAPFDAWPGLRPFWQDVLFQELPEFLSPPELQEMPGATPESLLAMAGAVSDRVNPYPSLLLLGVLVAGFILVLGPVNYGVLRHRRVPLLAVVTLPALSFLLLGLLFAAGTAIKGVSVRAFSVRVLQAREGDAWAKEQALLSIYSPSTREYDVSAAGGLALVPPGRNAWERSHPFVAETGAGITTRALPLSQWQTGHLAGNSVRPLGKGVRFSVSAGQVVVENGTPHDLEGCTIRGPGPEPWIRVGRVSAGATARVPVAAARTLREALDLPADALAAAALIPHSRRHPSPDAPRVLLAVLKNSEPAGLTGGASRPECATLLAVAEARR